LHAVCRWWLGRYSDSTLAELALGLGVEDACAENVARARRRLRLVGGKELAPTSEDGP
jgi:hypothetical protein